MPKCFLGLFFFGPGLAIAEKNEKVNNYNTRVRIIKMFCGLGFKVKLCVLIFGFVSDLSFDSVVELIFSSVSKHF